MCKFAHVRKTQFEIEKTIVPAFAYEGVSVTSEILTFHHDESNFQIWWEKYLTGFDVTSEFMVFCFCITLLFLEHFCQMI